MAELRVSMLELEKITGSAETRRLLEQIDRLTKELAAAREALGAQHDSASLIGELRQQITSLEGDVARRDEQVEFLMQVHDAAAETEWVAPWQCPQCTFANKTGEANCQVCGAKRPTDSTTPVSSQTEKTCGACTYRNSTASIHCEMCGAALSEHSLESIL